MCVCPSLSKKGKKEKENGLRGEICVDELLRSGVPVKIMAQVYKCGKQEGPRGYRECYDIDTREEKPDSVSI